MKKLESFSLLSSSPLEYLRIAIFLIPVWWILGIRFMIFQTICFLILLKIIKMNRGKLTGKFPLEGKILFLYISVYILSLIINSSNIPFPRFVGSVNNLSFWVMGLVLIFVFSISLNSNSFERLIQSFPIIGFLSGLFVMGAVFIGFLTKNVYEFKSLVLSILPDKWIEIIYAKALLLRSSLKLTIVGKDKLFQKLFFRSPGFNIYSTALALTMIILLIFTILHFRKTKNRKALIIIGTLELIALCLSLSRTAILGFILASLIVFVLAIKKQLFWKRIFPASLLILCLFLLVVSPAKIFNTLSNFRKGSTVWRARLYKHTIQEGLKKPVFGHGFKPRKEAFPIPVGSHSTFIGVFYKTGFVGLLIFLCFWIMVIRKWLLFKKIPESDSFLQSVWILIGVALISGLFWMLTEDLDAPPIASFLYFIVVGIGLSLKDC